MVPEVPFNSTTVLYWVSYSHSWSLKKMGDLKHQQQSSVDCFFHLGNSVDIVLHFIAYVFWPKNLASVKFRQNKEWKNREAQR